MSRTEVEHHTISTNGEHAGTRRTRRAPHRAVLDVLIVLVGTALVSTGLNLYVLQAFVIPSSSMAPTLAVGDRVLVLRSTANPRGIARGDVVVFEDSGGWLSRPGVQVPDVPSDPAASFTTWLGLNPDAGKSYLTKRVIGVGGDTIRADGSGALLVNGVALSESYLPAGTSGSTEAFEVTVPAGYVWVMGDNREHSADSRSNRDDGHGGCVPQSAIVGVAVARWFPFDRAGGLGGGRSVFAGLTSR